MKETKETKVNESRTHTIHSFSNTSVQLSIVHNLSVSKLHLETADLFDRHTKREIELQTICKLENIKKKKD